MIFAKASKRNRSLKLDGRGFTSSDGTTAYRMHRRCGAAGCRCEEPKKLFQEAHGGRRSMEVSAPPVDGQCSSTGAEVASLRYDVIALRAIDEEFDKDNDERV
jgi:hypothetical protein